MSLLPISSSTEIALDANVCIDLLNSPADAGRRLGTPATVLVPLIVFGELLYGAYHPVRVDQNLRRIDEFRKLVQILGIDWATAVRFGQVRHELISKGKTIPDDDMWIAAAALQRGVPLVTRDKHFHEVSGLTIIEW